MDFPLMRFTQSIPFLLFLALPALCQDITLPTGNVTGTQQFETQGNITASGTTLTNSARVNLKASGAIYLKPSPNGPVIISNGALVTAKIVPAVSISQPVDGSTAANLRPSIAATVTALLRGVNRLSLQLQLDGATPFTPAGVQWTPTSSPSGSGSISYAFTSDLPVGPHLLNILVSDLNGNTATVPVHFTIDNTPPVITVPPNVTVEATASSGAIATYSPATATDNFTASPSISYSQSSGTVFPIGTTTVTVTAVDSVGNTSTATFTVTVRDTTAPAVTAPQNLIVEATSAQGAVVTNLGTPTATDAVTAHSTITFNPPAGSTFPLGVNAVTFSATDAAGNVGAATFNVTVRDTTAPVVTPPANIVIEATSAQGATVASLGQATATDAVTPSPTITYSADAGVFPLGVTPITVTAKDAAGNVGTATFTVTVRDTTKPALMPPPDLVVEATSAAGAVISDFGSVTATDAVTAHPFIAFLPAAGSTFPVGVTQVTVTAEDDDDNVATATFNVTVRQSLLKFTVQPANTTVGVALTSPVVVSFVDQNNVVETDRTGSVTLALGTNPSGGMLSGNLTAFAVNGVATFPNLSINQVGFGYTLTASSQNLTTVNSAAFNITPPPPMITSPTTLTVLANLPLTYTITATNHPTSYSAMPLPEGLTLDSTTGIISGSIAQPGQYSVTIIALDSGEMGTSQLLITVLGGLDTLNVTDVTDANNNASDPPTNSTLIVATGSDGLAHVSVAGGISDATPDRSKYLWRIEGAGATPSAGSFAVTNTIALPQNGVVYLVKAGMDLNNNGVLDDNEVQHQIAVYVVTLNWVVPGASGPQVTNQVQVSDPKPTIKLMTTSQDVVINGSMVNVTIRGFVQDAIANGTPRGKVSANLADIDSVSILINGQSAAISTVTALDASQFSQTSNALFNQYPYMGRITASTVSIPLAAGSKTLRVQTSPNAAGRTGYANLTFYLAQDPTTSIWKVSSLTTSGSSAGSYSPMSIKATIAPLQAEDFKVVVQNTLQSLPPVNSALYIQDGPIIAVRDPQNANQVKLMLYDRNLGQIAQYVITGNTLGAKPSFPLNTSLTTVAAPREVAQAQARAETPPQFNSLVFARKTAPDTWNGAPPIQLIVQRSNQTGYSYLLHMDGSSGMDGSFSTTSAVLDSSPFSFTGGSGDGGEDGDMGDDYDYDDDSNYNNDPFVVTPSWNPGTQAGAYTKTIKPAGSTNGQ